MAVSVFQKKISDLKSQKRTPKDDLFFDRLTGTESRGFLSQEQKDDLMKIFKKSFIYISIHIFLIFLYTKYKIYKKYQKIKKSKSWLKRRTIFPKRDLFGNFA